MENRCTQLRGSPHQAKIGIQKIHANLQSDPRRRRRLITCHRYARAVAAFVIRDEHVRHLEKHVIYAQNPTILHQYVVPRDIILTIPNEETHVFLR